MSSEQHNENRNNLHERTKRLYEQANDLQARINEHLQRSGPNGADNERDASY